MKLSIIVPVYKVEKYLNKCVESILNQTFKDFELILVDDGSPDSSGELCEQWKKKDHRIKVIHKKNGGLSDARNAGINIATGEYLGFVDSDDYIKPDMFEVLINNLENNKADISICGYIDVYANGNRNESLDRTTYVWDKKMAIRQILLGKMLSVHAVTKLYKRFLFDTVRYPVGKVSEDAYVIMDIMDKVNTTVFTPYSAYYYNHREESINTITYREIDKTRIEAHKKNFTYIQKNFPELSNLAFERYIGSTVFVLTKMILGKDTSKNSDYYHYTKEVRHNLLKIYKGNYFPLKRKITITILIINPALYRWIIKKSHIYN